MKVEKEIPVRYMVGCYGSMAELWKAYPDGGKNGWRAKVGTITYYWDSAQRNWRCDVYPSVDSYRLLKLDGDLSVGHNMSVGGQMRVSQNARFKRDVTIEGTLLYSHLRGMDCGLHPNVDALRATFPTPRAGEWALVGTSVSNLALYGCRSEGTWSQMAAGQSLAGLFDLSAYDAARSVVDDICESGYIFQGVATPDTAPITPADYNVFYLTSTPGTYVHFGGLEVKYLSVLKWKHNADTDANNVPQGRWEAQVILNGVFVYGENIASESISVEHLAGDVIQYIDGAINSARIALLADLNKLEQKLRGVGPYANAGTYPTFRLGDFSTMDEVNNAINQVYSDEGCTTHQGHLRLTRNGQMIFIDQYAIDYSVGKWAQVAFGMVAPSADGLQLKQAGDHPHILWRMAGVDDDRWHDISGTMSLKTINGQSLLGEGNIVVGGGGGTPITIDEELDPTSHNPLSNYGVAMALQNVIAECKIFPMYEVIKVSEDDEGDPLPLDAPEGSYAVLSGMLLTFVDGTWETVKKGDGEAPVTSFYYKYNDAVYVCDEGDIAYGFSVGSHALYRCHRHPQTRVVLPDGLYIRGNTLISRSGGVDTEALGDPNAFYVIVEENKMYVVDGEVPSSQLKQLSDNITPIFEVKNIDVIHQHPSDMSLPYGYYVYQNESEDGLQLYYHGVGSWIERGEPKAYLIYNNEVVLYNNNNLSYTGIKFRESQPPFIKIIASSPSTHPQTVSENGYYIYNNSQSVPAIFKYHNGTWTEQTAEVLPKAYVIWADNLWKYENGQLTDPVPYGGGGSTTQVQADWSQTNQSAPDFIKNKDRVENRLNELEVAEIARADEDTSDEKLYPEYWLDGEPVYAKNYYNWNTVRYNSAISNPGASDPSVVQDDLPSGTTAVVLHPSEHLNGALTYTQSLKDTTSNAKKLLTEDVYYDQDNHIFLLKIGSTYYKHWTNSYLWQNEGALREDTVYSSITPGESVTSMMKAIIQWKVENGVIVPLTEGDALSCCTDFSTAFAACLAANNGNMRLRSNRIYGLCKPIGDISYDNFVIDGQGATICYIPRRRKEPQGSSSVTENSAYPAGNVLKFVSSNSFVVKNLKIKGVRTAVRNVASGVPFCFSNTDMFGIRIFDCSDVRIENVEMTGMGYDFGIDGTDNDSTYHITDKVVIKDWKSKASEGLFMKMVSNLVVDGADVEQGKYSSKHLIYCNDSRFAKNHVIMNSRLIQNSIYNPNIIQYKTSRSTPSTDPATGLLRVGNLTLYNCFLQVGRGILNSTHTNTFNLNLERCTFMQHSQRYDGSIGYWASGTVYRMNQQSRAIISTNCWSNLLVKDCNFITWGAAIYLHNQEHDSLADSPSVEDPKIRIEDSSFVVLDPANYSNYASSLFATSNGNRLIYLEVSNMGGHDYSFETHNVKSNINHLMQADRLNKANAIEEISKRAELQASASAASFGTGLPVGYCYFNTVAGKPLWIASIAQDNTYNWVDAMGNPYTTNGGQVTP